MKNNKKNNKKSKAFNIGPAKKDRHSDRFTPIDTHKQFPSEIITKYSEEYRKHYDDIKWN
jgi:hypothetical protein